MATHKLQNYLQAYRKKSGLTQREVAFLLGCQDGAQVSRYEKRRRVPPLRMALACEAVFGVPVSQLFAGMREEVEARLQKVEAQLRSKTGSSKEARMTAQNLKWLEERRGPEGTNQHPTA